MGKMMKIPNKIKILWKFLKLVQDRLKIKSNIYNNFNKFE